MMRDPLKDKREYISESKIVLHTRSEVVKAESLSKDTYSDKNFAIYACGNCFTVVFENDEYCWHCGNYIGTGTLWSVDNFMGEVKRRKAEKQDNEERSLEEVNDEMLKR